MLQRPDARTLLRHAAALLSAVSARRLEFVTAFLLHGLADKLTAAEMEAVWLPFLPLCRPSARPSHCWWLILSCMIIASFCLRAYDMSDESLTNLYLLASFCLRVLVPVCAHHICRCTPRYSGSGLLQEGGLVEACFMPLRRRTRDQGGASGRDMARAGWRLLASRPFSATSPVFPLTMAGIKCSPLLGRP